MKTKKLFALLLALVMCLSLAACGGSDEPVESDPVGDVEVSEPVNDPVSAPEEEEDAGSDALTDSNGDAVTQETINTLSAAYNAIAIPYNDIIMAVNENGWMADEQTAAEIDAVSNVLGFVGTALTEDLSMLDGTDFDALIDSLETEFPDVLDILSERVSVPYEG